MGSYSKAVTYDVYDAIRAIPNTSTIELNPSTADLGTTSSIGFGIGLRFLDIDIPKNATILSARLFLRNTSGNTNTPSVYISAENVDSAENLNISYATFSTRYATHTSQINWTFLSTPTAAILMTSPDISSVVQTIVDRSGWVSGNDMVLFVEDFAERNSTTKSVIIDEYYGADKLPTLEIVYDVNKPTFVERFHSIPVLSSGWQNYDIYTNLGVPKGAIAHIVCSSVNDASARTIGVRTDGSSNDTRYIKLHEGEAGGSVNYSTYVTVNATTGLIETYCDDTTGVTLYLTGYWIGTTYTEYNAVDYISIFTTSGSWTSPGSDLFPWYGGAVLDWVLANKDNGASIDIGVRNYGTSNNRFVTLHEAESSTTEYTDCTAIQMLAKTGVANKNVEYYVSSGTYASFYLMGWFSTNMDYVSSIQTGSVTATGWTDWDVTSYLDVDGRVCDIYCANASTNTEFDFGARQNGSSLSRYITVHESESNGYNGFALPAGTDTSGILELYASDSSSENFRYLGYYKPATTYSIPETSDATLASSSTTYPIYETSDAQLKGTKALTKTSDAQLKKLGLSITETSDALLIKNVSLTKTSDARLLKNWSLTKTSDARLKKEQSFTKTSDARIVKPISITETSDARIIKPVSITETSDAQLKKLGITFTETSDATLAPGLTTYNIYETSDAQLKKLGISLTKSSDARLLKVRELTETSDANLKGALSLTETSDARIIKPISITETSDANLKKLAIEITETSDARLLSVGSITETSDARLLKIGTVTETSDARLLEIGTLTETSDATLVKVFAITETSDANLKGTLALTESSDTQLKGTLFLTETSDSRLKRAYDLTETSDARLLKVGAVSETSDATLVALGEITETSDAMIVIRPCMKGRYDMETLNGSNLKDLSGYGNDGVPYGGITIGGVTGISGNATDFDGNNDYINLGTGSTITNISSNNLSLIAWVKPDALGIMTSIIDSTDSTTSPYAMRINASGQVEITLKLSGTQYTKTFGSVGAIATGVWTMIAFTFDGTDWKCYINKIPQTPQTQAGTLDSTSNGILLGRFVP